MCKHWNKGFCKHTNCHFVHAKEDCETHLSGYVCKKKDGKMRHRKMCRYWCKDGCRRKSNCSYLHQTTHMKNKPSATEDESKSKSGKDDSYSEKDLKCQLCNEGLDDNDDIKKHYITEHMEHLKKVRGCSKCEVEYCMEIQEDNCSQFCFYYKNLLRFDVKETYM